MHGRIEGNHAATVDGLDDHGIDRLVVIHVDPLGRGERFGIQGNGGHVGMARDVPEPFVAFGFFVPVDGIVVSKDLELVVGHVVFKNAMIPQIDDKIVPSPIFGGGDGHEYSFNFVPRRGRYCYLTADFSCLKPMGFVVYILFG